VSRRQTVARTRPHESGARLAMASFFLSHASRDTEIAVQLRSWLVEHGYAAIFLDFDPQAGIPPGRQWESELYAQLRRADVLISWGA
jgi:TIR domain